MNSDIFSKNTFSLSIGFWKIKSEINSYQHILLIVEFSFVWQSLTKPFHINHRGAIINIQKKIIPNLGAWEREFKNEGWK